MKSPTSQSAISTQAVDKLAHLPLPILLFIAARVKTLGLSLAPVAAGSWLAALSGGWHPEIMLAAMLAAAAIQIGTNLWNDAADGGRGADGLNRLGPPRMTGLGLLDASLVRRAALFAFAIAALIGVWLAMIGGWAIVAIGLVSLGLGYFYSMGPRPLSHTALGEGLVVLFFGVIAVAGTVYLHGQPVSALVLSVGVITGFPAAAVLLLNNHRDREQDQIAGRRTLAILIGQAATRRLYGGLLIAALIGGFGLSASDFKSLLPLLPALGLGAVLITTMARTPISSRLNRLIAGTVGFQGLLLLGIAGAWWVRAGG